MKAEPWPENGRDSQEKEHVPCSADSYPLGNQSWTASLLRKTLQCEDERDVDRRLGSWPRL